MSGFKLLAVLLVAVALVACVNQLRRPADGQTWTTQPSRIAITLDDLPYLAPSRTTPDQGLQQVEAINRALAKYGIVATGFAVGQQITPDTAPALDAFVTAGHQVGNHSWSHPDYGTLTPEAFEDETRRTDAALAPWMDGPKYYRFPFLREGETEAAKAAADRILSDLGYLNVPVTVDNEEWRFNADYEKALSRGNPRKAARIAAEYLVHMRERTAHFQTMSVDGFGADIDHILLLHLNQINADHLEELLDWYAAQGWAFITVDEALAHPFYQRPDLYAGPRGLSQIERVLAQ